MSDKKDIAGQLRVWAHDAALQDALDHCRGLNEAAREIERLRSVVEAWKTYSSRAERDIAGLREERDEARRSVCKMSIQLGGVYRRVGGKIVEVTTPEGCAEIMRWDCFKETTDER